MRQHDGGARVDFEHRGQQVQLRPRQFPPGPVEALGLRPIGDPEEQHRHIGVARRGNGCRRQASVIAVAVGGEPGLEDDVGFGEDADLLECGVDLCRVHL